MDSVAEEFGCHRACDRKMPSGPFQVHDQEYSPEKQVPAYKISERDRGVIEIND